MNETEYVIMQGDFYLMPDFLLTTQSDEAIRFVSEHAAEIFLAENPIKDGRVTSIGY